MNRFDKIITLLIAIQNFAKDIHYNAKGDAFYSKHLFCDRIEEPIADFIDEIKEVVILGSGEVPPPSKEYLRNAVMEIPDITSDDRTSFEMLLDLISRTLQTIEELDNMTKGEENVFGGIAQHLQTMLGLLNRQVL